jgi:hypothetical protein
MTLVILLALAAVAAASAPAARCADRIVIYSIYGFPRVHAERLHIAEIYHERLAISNGDSFGAHWAMVRADACIICWVAFTFAILSVELRLLFLIFPVLRREMALLKRSGFR